MEINNIFPREIAYSYNDIGIVPAEVSYINHRSECNPYINDKLPIFTAPMSSIVGLNNYKLYDENKIIPILPRTVALEDRIQHAIGGDWVAMSLNEFVENFNGSKLPTNSAYRICVDIANGHMFSLWEKVKEIKEEYSQLIVMVGNIANPMTYKHLCEYPIDYVRVGIGGGNGCITSSNTGIHYPMASLISEIKKIKETVHKFSNNSLPKIIADGGIRNYSDVIKALALGADYVMIGSVFAECRESSDEIYYDWKFNKINKHLSPIKLSTPLDYIDKNEINIYHKFYGMASKEGQLALNGEVTHTAEGISKFIPIKYTLPQWTKNMEDYLRSAMSYTNAKTLEQFKAEIIILSNNTFNSVNK